MTDYAATINKRDGHKKSERYVIKDREDFTLYEGADANNNWVVKFWLRKDQTAAANNDTITVTLG